jgi:DNA-binding protein H-NS
MGLSDRVSQLTKKARETAAEHKDQLEQAIDKAAAVADRRTGGKYNDQIAKAKAQADAYLKELAPQPEAEPGAATPAANPPPQAATQPDEKPTTRA